MKLVPLHSLTIIFGECIQGRQEVLSKFGDHEIINFDKVRYELVGDSSRGDLKDIISSEVVRRISLKLRLGQRVVVDAPYLDRAARSLLVNPAASVGVPVFYLLAPNLTAIEEIVSHTQEILRGDGLAEVIDSRKIPIVPVQLLPDTDPLSTLRLSWHGITVISDVHGMYQSMLEAISWARSRQHFMLFIGDIIDYGPGSLDVSDEVYRAVMRGEAELILGNHERKIMRWIDGHRVRLSEGNRVTTSALNALGETTRARWVGRFRGLYQNTRLIRTFDSVTLVHAALHPEVWNGAKEDQEIEHLALFGEIDEENTRPDRLVKSYRWCDAIPTDQTVIVGHDIRSYSHPFRYRNAAGGEAVFLDTGSGKGGSLTSADLRFTETGIRLENFNMH